MSEIDKFDCFDLFYMSTGLLFLLVGTGNCPSWYIRTNALIHRPTKHLWSWTRLLKTCWIQIKWVLYNSSASRELYSITYFLLHSTRSVSFPLTLALHGVLLQLCDDFSVIWFWWSIWPKVFVEGKIRGTITKLNFFFLHLVTHFYLLEVLIFSVCHFVEYI